jgi:hypothetical protein
VSNWSGSKAPPGGVRTLRSRWSGPGSTAAQSRLNARPPSGAPVGWTRPPASTPSPPPGRHSPNPLGPVQTRVVYDPLVAKIKAVLEPRRLPVTVRTLVLHHVQDQLSNLPVEIRDPLTTTGTSEARLRRLEPIAPTVVATTAGEYRRSWLIPLVDHDRTARRQIRPLEADIDALLDEHGTTRRDQPGVGPIAAATLLVEVGDPFRFARESKSLAGPGPAPSRCHQARAMAGR